MARQLLANSMLFFVLVIFLSPGHAQLGPVDGGGLDPEDLNRVAVGSMAPDFTLEDSDGNKVTLSGFRSNKNVVLVFYRGHW